MPNVDTGGLDVVPGKFSTSPISKKFSSKLGGGNVGKFAALAGVTTFLTGTLGMSEEQAEEEVARDPSKYLSLYYKNLNPKASELRSARLENLLQLIHLNMQKVVE